MLNRSITKDELLYAVRGLNIKDFSIKELEYLSDLFQIKNKQIEEEIRKRKREGKD